MATAAYHYFPMCETWKAQLEWDSAGPEWGLARNPWEEVPLTTVCSACSTNHFAHSTSGHQILAPYWTSSYPPRSVQLHTTPYRGLLSVPSTSLPGHPWDTSYAYLSLKTCSFHAQPNLVTLQPEELCKTQVWAHYQTSPCEFKALLEPCCLYLWALCMLFLLPWSRLVPGSCTRQGVKPSRSLLWSLPYVPQSSVLLRCLNRAKWTKCISLVLAVNRCQVGVRDYRIPFLMMSCRWWTWCSRHSDHDYPPWACVPTRCNLLVAPSPLDGWLLLPVKQKIMIFLIYDVATVLGQGQPQCLDFLNICGWKTLSV